MEENISRIESDTEERENSVSHALMGRGTWGAPMTRIPEIMSPHAVRTKRANAMVKGAIFFISSSSASLAQNIKKSKKIM
jgi:hypothetical protein